jgi:predicted nucleic acid-binding Zn ribbon protein
MTGPDASHPSRDALPVSPPALRCLWCGKALPIRRFRCWCSEACKAKGYRRRRQWAKRELMKQITALVVQGREAEAEELIAGAQRSLQALLRRHLEREREIERRFQALLQRGPALLFPGESLSQRATSRLRRYQGQP